MALFGSAPRDANGAFVGAFKIGATSSVVFTASTAASIDSLAQGIYRAHTTQSCFVAADGKVTDADGNDMPFDAAQSGLLIYVETDASSVKIFGGAAGGTFSLTRLI